MTAYGLRANEEEILHGAPCRGCSGSDLRPAPPAEEVVTHSGLLAVSIVLLRIPLGVSVTISVRIADDFTPASGWAAG